MSGRLLYLFLLLPSFFIAQYSVLDSLKDVLSRETNKEKKLEIFSNIFEFKIKNKMDLKQSEIDSVLNYADAHHLDTSNTLRKIYICVLDYYTFRSLPTEYIKYALRYLVYLFKLSEYNYIITIHINISQRYTGLHLFEEAEKILADAQKILSDKITDNRRKKALEMGIYDAYAYLYYEQNMYDKALEYGKKTYTVAKEIQNKDYIERALNTIAICYNDMGKHFEALKILFEIKALDKEINGDISVDYYNIANTYVLMKNTDMALKYIDSAFYYYHKLGLKNPEILSECYYLLMEIYIIKGNTEKAFEYRTKFFEVKDSINESNFREELARQSTVYQLDLKEMEKKKLIAEKKQQRYIIVGSVIVICISALLIVAVYRSYKIKQKAAIELERKNNVIEVQKKLVEDQNKNITDSIHYASRIQRALLATDEYLSNHFKSLLTEYFILYLPKDIVSGDFYWAAQKNNYFYFVVGDSTGHGVPGAFMSLLNINFLNEAIIEKNISETGKIFDYVKQQLITHLHGEKDGMDATIVRLDMNNKNTIQYSAANHQPVLINNNKELIKCKNTKSPIGVDINNDIHFETYELSLQKGDILYLFTDGYADQFGGEKDKKLQRSNFYRLLQQYASLPANEQKELLKKIFTEWKGANEQTDDVCVAGLFFG